MRALGIFVIVLLALVLAKDAVLMYVIEREVKDITGIRLDIRSLRVALASTTVEIKGFKAYNPEGFEEELMADIPEIYADFLIRDLLRNKVHLKKLNIFATEFNVVRNSKGELNLDALKVLEKPKEGEEPQKKKGPKFEIDVFRLKLGKVVFMDYSKGPVPAVKNFDIKIDQEFYDITEPDTLVKIVVLKAMRDTRLANVLGFDLSPLQGGISGILAGANNVVNDAASGAAKTFAGAADELHKTTSGLKEVLFLDGSKNRSKNKEE